MALAIVCALALPALADAATVQQLVDLAQSKYSMQCTASTDLVSCTFTRLPWTARITPGGPPDAQEKTLDTLLEDRVIAAWQYDRWEETLATRHGWAQHWLQGTILIEPPESIRATYQRLARHEAPPRPALPTAASLGQRLKRHRKTLGLTQLQAAEQLGISHSYLNRLEQGNRGKKPSPAVQRTLDTWLGAHLVPQTSGETPPSS